MVGVVKQQVAFAQLVHADRVSVTADLLDAARQRDAHRVTVNMGHVAAAIESAARGVAAVAVRRADQAARVMDQIASVTMSGRVASSGRTSAE